MINMGKLPKEGKMEDEADGSYKTDKSGEGSEE